MKLRLRRLPLLALISLFITMLALGALPGEANALSARFGDKFLHALAYGALSALAYVAIDATPRAQALGCASVVAVLGLIDEGVQLLLPWRRASLLDWSVDLAAAAIVILLFSLRARTSITLQRP